MAPSLPAQAPLSLLHDSAPHLLTCTCAKWKDGAGCFPHVTFFLDYTAISQNKSLICKH